MARAVFCVAKTHEQAEQILSELKSINIPNRDVSVILPDPTGRVQAVSSEQHTKATEGAEAGLAGGIVGGGILGWLVGIGSLALPGIGPLLAAGPLVAMLGGAAIGGAVGGLSGGLIGMGLTEDEVNLYLGRIRSGYSIIAVDAENADEGEKARNVFQLMGAEDISPKLAVDLRKTA
jgi:hypothetical protein